MKPGSSQAAPEDAEGDFYEKQRNIGETKRKGFYEYRYFYGGQSGYLDRCRVYAWDDTDGILLLTVVAPVFIGIPTMLFYTKIKKFGMILIYAVINGIIMVLTGMGAGALLCGVICSFFAELILKAGNYKSKNMCVIAYAVASLATAGNYLQWLHASDAWLQKKAGGYGEEYVSTISGYFGHAWLFPLLILLSFAGGLIGGLLGRAVLKKHFERSGLV